MLALSGIKTRTAPAVQKLLDADARFVGKTITDELALSMNGQNAHFGSLTSDGEAGMDSYRNRALQMLCVAGLAGPPQLSLPLATRLGAPLGLSLVGPSGSDRGLVTLAQRIVG